MNTAGGLLIIAVVCLSGIGVSALPAYAGAIRVEAMADWEIVLPPDAIPSEEYAAEELQKFFEQATGLLLPITKEPRKTKGGHIYVGASEAMKASKVGFDTNEFGPEDLRVVVGDSAIAIAGGRPRGTLYGVYTFLEDCLGVRFLTPEHTHVPRLGPGRVLKPMDKSYSPPLVFRFSNAGENNDHAFAVRLRQNSSFGRISERLGGESHLELINHSFSRYVPWSKYGKTHPEYFGERDGQRPTKTLNDHYGPGVQLCTTNPDVRRLIIEGVLKDLDNQPGRGNISVSQNDNRQFCQCPECSKLDEAAGSHMGAHLALVNEVADAVAAKYPGVLVGTLAYQYTRKPPANITPRPNVQIQLCSIETCLIHPIDDTKCPNNAGFCKDLKGWGKISDNVFIWNYVANFRNYLIPCPLLRSVGPNIRFFVKNNVRGIFMQAPTFGANLGGLRNYVICNMLWDPTRDENQLIEEFLRLHYGSQADAVREYIDIIHDAAEASGLHENCFGRPQQYGISPEVARRGLSVLEKAMDTADDDAIRRRLERETIGCYAVLVDPVTSPAMQKAHSRAHGMDDGKPVVLDGESMRSARPYLRKFLELCRKHGVKQFSERVSVDVLEQMLREGYNLGENEEL